VGVCGWTYGLRSVAISFPKLKLKCFAVLQTGPVMSTGEKNPPKNTKVTAQNTRCASLNDRPVDVFFFLAFWGCRRRRRTGESACVDRRSTFPQRFTDDQLEPGAAWPYLEAYAPYGFVRPPSRFGIKGRGSETFLFAGGRGTA